MPDDAAAGGRGDEQLAEPRHGRRGRSRRARSGSTGTSRQPRTARPSSAAMRLDARPGLGAPRRRRRAGTRCRRRSEPAGGSGEVDDRAQERVRDLGEDAGAVAGVRLGARRRRGGRGCAAPSAPASTMSWPACRAASRRRRRRRRRARAARSYRPRPGPAPRTAEGRDHGRPSRRYAPSSRVPRKWGCDRGTPCPMRGNVHVAGPVVLAVRDQWPGRSGLTCRRAPLGPVAWADVRPESVSGVGVLRSCRVTSASGGPTREPAGGPVLESGMPGEPRQTKMHEPSTTRTNGPDVEAQAEDAWLAGVDAEHSIQQRPDGVQQRRTARTAAVRRGGTGGRSDAARPTTPRFQIDLVEERRVEGAEHAGPVAGTRPVLSAVDLQAPRQRGRAGRTAPG